VENCLLAKGGMTQGKPITVVFKHERRASKKKKVPKKKMNMPASPEVGPKGRMTWRLARGHDRAMTRGLMSSSQKF